MTRRRYFGACLVGVSTWLSVGALAQTAPNPADRLSEEWKQVRSTNFLVVGNASERDLRDAIVQLERFRETVLPLFPSSQQPTAVPIEFVLFKDRGAMRLFNPRDHEGKIDENIVGYFSRMPDLVHMVSSVSRDSSETYGVLFHEYAHHLVHHSGRGVPTWVDEGLAEFFSTLRIERDGSAALLGVSPPRRRVLSPDRAFLPFERFVDAEGVAKTFRSEAAVQVFYAQAWALVHYLVLNGRTGQLDTYLKALQDGQSQDTAFVTGFGVPYSGLLPDVRAYLKRATSPAVRITFSAPLAAVKAPVERIREVDALAIQGRVLVDTGALGEAEKMLGHVLGTDPQHVAARIALARVHAARDRKDDALATLQTVVTEHPTNFSAKYWLTDVLLDADQYDEALQVSSASVRLNDRSADAWWQLSVAAAVLGRASQAEAAIALAKQFLPNPMWRASRGRRLYAMGRFSESARDLRVYADEAGWSSEAVPYQIFIAALAYWHVRADDDALALLARLEPEVDPATWTAMVLRFLQGRAPEKEFLDRAKGIGEETEAHAYIGIKAAIAGRTQEALTHLEWVEKRGARNYIEYGLAREALAGIRGGGAK